MKADQQTGVRFLGTGAADWTTDHQCGEDCRERCAKARELGGRNLRRFSSIFVAPDTIVDFTAHALAALDEYGIRREAIRNVVITHGHYDHFQPAAILEFASGLPHPVAVYGNATVGHALDFAARHAWDPGAGRFVARDESPNVEFEPVTPGQPFAAGAWTAIPVLANHMIDKRRLIPEQQALNYILELDGRTLFYGLDSSFMLPRAFEALGRHAFDAAIFDATFGDMEIDPERSGHQNFAMLRETIAQFRQHRLFRKGAAVIASHISRCCVDHHDAIVERLRKAGTALAYDGMTL